jgi:UDP-glucose 4-epimerase
VEWVFHLAPPVGPEHAAWAEDAVPIDQGIWQVLIAARDSLVQRVVYASSMRVYGEAPGAPLSEHDAACPRSAYAIAKLSGEQDCTTFTHMYGLATVRLRYSNVFGPRQAPSPCADDLILRLGRALFTGESPLLPGDGLQPLDLLFIDDAIEATLLAAEAPQAPGKVFNIGRGIPVTPLQVAARLGHLMGGGYRPPLLGGPLPPAELSNLVDVTRARTTLCFRPEMDLDSELARCVAGHGWGGAGVKYGRWRKMVQGW